VEKSEEITQLLKRSNDGDEAARERVMDLVYKEMHRIAKRHAWRAGETMRPTVLVNEAYVKLFKNQGSFENRENLLACAALAMRQLILNSAEKAGAAKRGGGELNFTLEEWDGSAPLQSDAVALNQVLEQLEQIHPRHARMLGLCYFAGFKNQEIADILQVSESTVVKDLRFAKVWIRKQLEKSGGKEAAGP